jgi:hypothetical protein
VLARTITCHNENVSLTRQGRIILGSSVFCFYLATWLKQKNPLNMEYSTNSHAKAQRRKVLNVCFCVFAPWRDE